VLVAWSPKTWFAARVFYGVALTASSLEGGGARPESHPYGMRATFFLP